MSNKHVNHQHGLHTMNETRPKSLVRKRTNKAKANARKAPLLAALYEARYGKKAEKVKVAKPAHKSKTAKAEKASAGNSKPAAAAKKKAATKKVAAKKA